MSRRFDFDRADLAAAASSLVWFVVVLVLSLLQLETTHNQSFDLALYTRSLWGVANGSFMNPIRDQHVFAIHGNWIFFVLAPLTYLFSTARLLLALQALSLSAAGLVFYAVARRRLSSSWMALAVAWTYFLYPVTMNTALFDFHTKTLALPFLVLGIDRLAAKKHRDIAAWMLLSVALLCREEIGVMLAALGISWCLYRDQRTTGVALAIVGVGFSAFYYLVVRNIAASDYASVQTHFAHLARSGGISESLGGDDAEYVLWLLGSLGFLPLAGIRYMAPVLIPIGMNLLSSVPGANQMDNHYSFLVVPFIILALIEALVVIPGKVPRAKRIAPVAALLCALTSYAILGTGPGGGRFVPEFYRFTEDATAARQCLGSIPDDVPAMAPPHLLAHLAEREKVIFRLSGDSALELDYVLFEAAGLPWIQDSPGYRRYIEMRRNQAAQLTAGFGFVEEKRCGPYVLLRRESRGDQ